MPAHLGKAMGVPTSPTTKSTTATRLTETGEIINCHHEGNGNYIDILCRSGGSTLTDIPEVAHHQVGLAAAALGITVLFG